MSTAPPAPEAPAPEVAAAASPAGKPRWKSLLSPKWLVVLLLASVAGHGLAFLLTRQDTPQPVAREVSLGRFAFAAPVVPEAKIVGAEFDLHIGLLEPADAVVRSRLTSHKLKLEQDIEELLRQAHGDDFLDPKLRELKRQLAEQINASLGVRAVDDVIVTDLVLEHPASPAYTEQPPPAIDEPRTARHGGE